MTNLNIEMTEAELFALDMIAVDKQEWADNVLTNRARVAKDGLKTQPIWSEILTSAAQNNVDLTDDWAVLLHGRDQGLVKTAAEIAAQQEALPTAEPAQTQEEIYVTDVAFAALTHKVGVINAASPTQIPVSKDAFDEMVKHYEHEVANLNAKKTLDQELTTDETTLLQNIVAGFAAFKAIDQSAKAIIETPDYDTAIADDTRWPDLS